MVQYSEAIATSKLINAGHTQKDKDKDKRQHAAIKYIICSRRASRLQAS